MLGMVSVFTHPIISNYANAYCNIIVDLVWVWNRSYLLPFVQQNFPIFVIFI